MTERYCGEIITPFIREVQATKGLPRIHIIGGNGSAALAHPEVRINTDYKTIEAPASCDLPQHRPDGTLRDADILVLETQTDKIEAIEEIANATIEGLEVSVFGLKPSRQLIDQADSPIRSSMKVFLGDRYIFVPPEYSRDGQIIGEKSLFPFAVEMPVETLDTYTLSLDGSDLLVPTSHPAATVLNYLTRSISGLRTKDAKKVMALADNVFKNPDMLEWVTDGPGKSTLNLARVLHTLRESRRKPQVLEVGKHLKIEPLDLAKLHDRPEFMYKSMGRRASRALVEVAHVKGRALHVAESQEKIVTWWQKNVERRIHGIVHND